MAEATLNEYEMLYILHPRLTEDGIQQSVERVSGLITSNGGEVLTVDNWGRRRLAYAINHELDGTYVLTTFKSPPTGTRPVEQQMLISEDILRHLLIRGIIPYEGPPEQIRERERERPPRPEGDAAEGGEAPAGETASETPEGEATAGEAPAAEAADGGPKAASEEAPAAEAAPEAEAPAGDGESAAAEATAEAAEAPSDDAPGDDAPGDDAPSDDAPSDDAPSDDAPSDDAAGDDASEADATSDGEEAPPTGGSG